jgi:hypothetical protein
MYTSTINKEIVDANHDNQPPNPRKGPTSRCRLEQKGGNEYTRDGQPLRQRWRIIGEFKKVRAVFLFDGHTAPKPLLERSYHVYSTS